ncbi:MAG: hypothetical protein ACYSR0_00835 [Planctomycetota bacterium]|jgi:hypothetical protein
MAPLFSVVHPTNVDSTKIGIALAPMPDARAAEAVAMGVMEIINKKDGSPATHLSITEALRVIDEAGSIGEEQQTFSN